MKQMQEHIVDFHIHSHYSRATSKNSTLEELYRWGKLKGISVIGTGDFTHPEWFVELESKLVPAEDGLLMLREDIAAAIDSELPENIRTQSLRFIPSVEISTIYPKNGLVRKLHQLIIMPGLESANALNLQLRSIGNLAADGRPILGFDSKELLRLMLATDPNALFIPAHIWTPWFGLFGSKSGFDSLHAAYEELTPYIYAIETGLSSDPAMNLKIADIQHLSITSNSDAHSPQKLGREATLVQSGLGYDDIISAYKTNDERLVGTLEFYPEEGKYYADGHRACEVRFTPEETRHHNGMCPVCGRRLVVGVNYRIGELGTHSKVHPAASGKRAEYIIPLAEILAELRGVKGSTGSAVTRELFRAYELLGNEFDILRSIPTEAIRDQGFPLLAFAIGRLRRHEIVISPGFDGVYGAISIFKNDEERSDVISQLGRS